MEARACRLLSSWTLLLQAGTQPGKAMIMLSCHTRDIKKCIVDMFVGKHIRTWQDCPQIGVYTFSTHVVELQRQLKTPLQERSIRQLERNLMDTCETQVLLLNYENVETCRSMGSPTINIGLRLPQYAIIPIQQDVWYSQRVGRANI